MSEPQAHRDGEPAKVVAGENRLSPQGVGLFSYVWTGAHPKVARETMGDEPAGLEKWVTGPVGSMTHWVARGSALPDADHNYGYNAAFYRAVLSGK